MYSINTSFGNFPRGTDIHTIIIWLTTSEYTITVGFADFWVTSLLEHP